MENAAASALLEAPTVWELVRTRAELSGDRPLLLEPSGRRVGFAEFAAQVERVAAGVPLVSHRRRPL